MIRDEKREVALRAIHDVLVAIRMLAYERAPHETIASLADVGELLPTLFLNDRDETEFFRDQLAGLADVYPMLGGAVHRFDDATPR